MRLPRSGDVFALVADDRCNARLEVFCGLDCSLYYITFFFNFGRHSELFCSWFGREFLEAWIVSKRIKHGIEPEQGGSERHIFSPRAIVGYRE